MRITELEIVRAHPRWQFLRIHTNTGLVGIADLLLEGHMATMRQAVRDLEYYLIGQDPRLIERHWQALYRGAFYRGGPVLMSALSSVEMCLWDILGQSLSTPLHQLLGGAVRQRIRVYAQVHGGASTDLAQNAAAAVAQGFQAIKVNVMPPVRALESRAWLNSQIERFGGVRHAIGQDVDMAVDCHGRLSPTVALQLAQALAPLHPLFLEEPCLPENIDALAWVAERSPVPIAAGERHYTRFGFRPILERHAAAVLQPDLCHAGGLGEVRKIAAMAEVYYVTIAPHNPNSPLNLAYGLHLDAVIPNFLCQEQVSLGLECLVNPFRLDEDGCLAVPGEPGLGVTLRPESLLTEDALADDPLPMMVDRDGAPADW
ncbi:MAG: galactonate dehydratase [Thermaerobacter sp.]|nr:galactonate dehydratase [Thermaerobacter sp.]